MPTSALSWTSTSQSPCACLWSCPWEPPPAGPTAIIAGPNGWRHSRSCSAMQLLLMEAAHWGLALIPVLVLLAVFEWLDAFELVSFREILVLLLLGGIAASLSWLAAIAHEFAERETREAASEFDFNLWWFVPGYLVAVALHAAFNQFPDRPLIAMLGAIIVAPLVLIAIFHFGTREAERWLVA